MESPAASWVVLALAWLASVALHSKLFSFWRSHKQNLPPGPKPWPIIGNLNLVGHLLHRSLHQLSQKYGQIMQLQLLSFPVVVASSSEMEKQFLKTNDHFFASRPQNAAGKYTGYNYSDVLWVPYGPHWRQGHKIYLTKVFCSKRLESNEYIRVEERRAFISRLYQLSGKPVMLKDQLSRLTLSIINRIVLGEEYFSESSIVTLKEFQEMLDELLFLNGVLNIGDWIPWIAFLDLQGYVKRMKAVSHTFDRFYDYVLEKHRVRVEADVFVASDMVLVDMLLKLADDPEIEVKLSSDMIQGFVQDLMAGGTDTPVTNMEWAMSEVLRQPRIAKKATEELDRVIGTERWVEEKDIPQLLYIDAIVKETMRLHPVAVLLAPH